MTTPHLDYFNGNQLAADVWYKKYRAEGETTPDDTLKRVAKEIARVLKNGSTNIRVKDKLSKYGKKRKELTEERVYELIKDFATIIPQGSILASVGLPSYSSLSNCVVLEPPFDSYGGIAWVDQQLAQLMKRRCGVGVDISTLRPKNTNVTNAAGTSTGAIGFMERFSNTTREVAQSGRRGALMLSMDCRHPDIEDFITVKEDFKKVTGANISVRWTDDFILHAQRNLDYTLRFPVDASIEKAQYTKKVNAREVWLNFCKAAHKSAEPGCLFWDHMEKYSTDLPYINILGVNPCAEIGMGLDTCRLVAVNLMSTITHPFEDKAYFADKIAYEIFYEAQIIVDAIVSLEIESIDRIINKIENDPEPYHIKQTELQTWEDLKKNAERYRRTGTGFLGLGDFLAALGEKYGDFDALKVVEKLMETKMKAEFDASIDLAIIYGSFYKYDFYKEKDTPFIKRLKIVSLDTYERMKLYGRRNISLSTVAPTGSVSQLAKIGNYFGTTSGIEPVFMLSYIRRRKVESDSKEYNYVNQEDGNKYLEYIVYHSGYKMWCEIRGKDPHKKHDNCPYVEAAELTPEDRIKLQSIVQNHVTHSISSTVNLPADTTVEEVERIYMLAWAYKLKGITIYREGSRSPILKATETKDNENISYNDAPKRPATLPCNIHEFYIHGKRWYTLIGLYEEKPYEVFAFRYDKDLTDLPKTGKITKNGKKQYTLHNGDVLLENISSLIEDGGLYKYSEEQTLARLVSLSLRHGIKPDFIFDQISKSAGTLGSFSRALVKVLNLYVENNDKCPECGGELIASEGCWSCSSCHFSKC